MIFNNITIELKNFKTFSWYVLFDKDAYHFNQRESEGFLAWGLELTALTLFCLAKRGRPTPSLSFRAKGDIFFFPIERKRRDLFALGEIWREQFLKQLLSIDEAGLRMFLCRPPVVAPNTFPFCRLEPLFLSPRAQARGLPFSLSLHDALPIFFNNITIELKNFKTFT